MSVEPTQCADLGPFWFLLLGAFIGTVIGYVGIGVWIERMLRAAGAFRED